jgi:hypothetical protein
VSFDNFYGNKNLDFEDIQSDAFTVLLEHDISDQVKLRNISRYSRTHRHSIFTAPRFTNAAGGLTTLNRQGQQRRMTSEALPLTGLSICTSSPAVSRVSPIDACASSSAAAVPAQAINASHKTANFLPMTHPRRLR